MTALFTLQLVLPLVFVLWIALAPPRSLLGFWIQFLATATGLLAAGLTGLWLLPPWWAPYAFGALLLLATVLGLRRRRPFDTRLPFSVMGWAGAVFFVVLGGFATYQAALPIAGRSLPSATVANLAFPLEEGTYLVVNGGYDISINAHMATLDLLVPQLQVWRGQSYGVDIVKINAAGLSSSGIQPPEPAAYLIYGTRVLAPCSGVVIASVDGLPAGPAKRPRAHGRQSFDLALWRRTRNARALAAWQRQDKNWRESGRW